LTRFGGFFFEWRLKMAKITMEMHVRYRFWVKPVLYFACVFYATMGKDAFSDGFVDWVVKHGMKVELSE
jgi:hypothetical protein